LANAVEAWSGPKCCWLQLLWMLQLLLLLLLRCMWHVAVDTRNYCHWAWLFGFSVSGFSCLFAGFSTFSFQFSTFLFQSPFVIFENSKLHFYTIFYHLPWQLFVWAL